MVGHGGQELGEQVAVCAMELNAAESRFDRQTRRRGEVLHDLLNLTRGQLTRAHWKTGDARQVVGAGTSAATQSSSGIARAPW